MNWIKKGLVFQAQKLSSWQVHSALTPTPILLNSNIIRVYAGFRDDFGISRIGFVDFNSKDPTKVMNVSSTPVLDRGRDGCFDDNGVILGDVIRFEDELRMYYVGFQLVKNVKFLAFSGLAISKNNGDLFQRVFETPILDRCPGESAIRAIHSAIYENNMWKIWYAAGDAWQKINDIDYPRYNIWYAESADGISNFQNNRLCIDVIDKEYRIGRPSVYKYFNQYYMLYTRGELCGTTYFPGMAISSDGIVWRRTDKDLGLNLSPRGFDSQHICYPRLIHVNNKIYCFYNGNHMGKEGIGLAENLEW